MLAVSKKRKIEENLNGKEMDSGVVSNDPPHWKRKRQNEEKEDQLDCSLLQLIPTDVWRNQILKFVKFEDLKTLRLTNRWFYRDLVTYPLWRPWISFTKLEAISNNKPAGSLTNSFNNLQIFCPSSFHLSTDTISWVPSYTKILDLSVCGSQVNDDLFPYLPRTLEKLVLPYYNRNSIQQKGILYLLTALPSLCIEFVDGLGKSTVLFWACGKGFLDIVQLIVQSKQDQINSLNRIQKETPLYQACYFGFKDIVRTLLHHNADSNLQRVDGKTPLIVASNLGYTDILMLLLQNGANASLKDAEGNTAISIVARNNYTPAIRIFKQFGYFK